MHSEITERNNNNQIKQQVDRILLSDTFRNSARLKAFLKLTVERTLEGRSSEIKQFLIATEVFERPAETFDPQIDPIVRVEAGRLRAKLREYYELEGGADTIVISYPKGGYVPFFQSRTFSGHTPLENHGPLENTEAPGPSSVADAANGRPAFPRRLAVLPFQDLSGRKDSIHLGQGVAAQIINRLARLPGLQVVSQTSSFLYQGSGTDIRVIGRELGVDAIIDGAVRTVGRKVMVTSQINDAATGYLLWSWVVERVRKDALAIQEEVARAVAQVITAELPALDAFTWDPQQAAVAS